MKGEFLLGFGTSEAFFLFFYNGDGSKQVEKTIVHQLTSHFFDASEFANAGGFTCRFPTVKSIIDL